MAAALPLLLLLCAATSAAAYSKIPISSKLKAGTNSSAWLSPSGVFAFGFYDTPNGYAVCIFLAAISEKTVVWTANNFDPILPNNADLVTIEEEGLLIWHITPSGYGFYDQIANPEEATVGGSMLDNGNFVLYNSDGGVIWQSFDFPTNTLLPGQRLLSPGVLFSRASETDLAIGRFRLKMQSDGNLVQYPVTTSDTEENAYYASGTYGAGRNISLNLENDGRLYLYDGYFDLYDIASGGGKQGKEGSVIYVARVDPDGIFRLYNRSLDISEGVWC